MSTDTDRMLGAGLLNMLTGIKQEQTEEREREAEILRAEGLARLNNRISQESSDSGYVMKDTGKPIKQSELEEVPLDKRMTASDFAIEQAGKRHTAEQQWTEPSRQRSREESIEDAKRKSESELAKERLKQSGMTERERIKQANKDRIKGKDKFSIMESINKAYTAYKNNESGELETGEKGGLFGMGDPILTDAKSKQQWIKDTYPPEYYDLFYGKGSKELVADNTSNTDMSGVIQSLLKKKETTPKAKKANPKEPKKQTGEPPELERGDSPLSKLISDIKSTPKDERDARKLSKKQKQARQFILKNMSPQQRQSYNKLSDKEKEKFIDSIIARRA